MAIESKMPRGPIVPRQSELAGVKYRRWLWVGLAVLVVIIGGFWYSFSNSDDLSTGGNTGKDDSSITAGEYQAVFLDNGQVYFGKLERGRADFYTLTDIYYIKTGGMSLDDTANVSLTKLGNEAHGPEDVMEINVSHILFIEDMKEDSKVLNAIKEHKRKK